MFMSSTITPTAEQLQVLQSEKSPVLIVDSQGNATHVAMPIEDARRMIDEYLRRELQIGFDQADAGQLTVLDIERTIAEARRRFNERNCA